MILAQALFWLFLSLIFYVYFGYPLLLFILSKLHPAPPVHKADITPTVSLIIPAHNEEKVIAQKIENSLTLDYPREKLEIIVVSDGSTDNTNGIVRRYEDQGVKLVRKIAHHDHDPRQNNADDQRQAPIEIDQEDQPPHEAKDVFDHDRHRFDVHCPVSAFLGGRTLQILFISPVSPK